MMDPTGLLTANIRRALEEALNGNIAVMPMHVRGNHWVVAMFRPRGDSDI